MVTFESFRWTPRRRDFECGCDWRLWVVMSIVAAAAMVVVAVTASSVLL
jgi:hypothetical protein